MSDQGQGKKLKEAARLLVRGELQLHDDEQPPEQEPDGQDEALAAFGLELGGSSAPPPEYFLLWPEHEPVLRIWFAVQTQWRHGMAGPTGLDYQGVQAICRLRQLGRGAELARWIADLQIMELAALDELARQRERSAKG